MRQVMVRYRVKPGRADENAELVRAVYEELERMQPDDFHYATFRLADGVTFVHIAFHGAADGSNPLSELPAFARFQEDIRARCDEPPVVSELHEVGSYGMAGVGA